MFGSVKCCNGIGKNADGGEAAGSGVLEVGMYALRRLLQWRGGEQDYRIKGLMMANYK